MQHFSTLTVSELTGASLRQIDYWATTALVKPSAKGASGKGTRRRYTFLDIVAVKAVCELRERGCPLQKIRKAVQHILKNDPTRQDTHQLAKLTLLTDGKEVYCCTDEHKVMEVVTRQHVWSLALGMLIQEVRSGVEALPTEWVETVKVGGKSYHLLIVRDDETGTFSAQCKELPGAIEQGDTAQEALANGKAAIQSVLDFLARQRRRSSGGKRVQAG